MTEPQIDQLEKSGEATGRLTAVAPFDGVVTKKHVREGEQVDQGAHLLTIADLTRLWAKFEAPESEVWRLREGQSVALAAEALPAQSFPGKIVFISPEVNLKTRTLTVVAEAANERQVLKPGMSVQVIVQSTEAGAKEARAQTQERLKLAQQRVQLLIEQYRSGQAHPNEIVAAQHDLLEARLSTAQNAQERSAALRDHHALLTDLLRLAQTQYHTGQATQADVLAIQAELLKSEQRIGGRSTDVAPDESATAATGATSGASPGPPSAPASTAGGDLSVLEAKLAAAETKLQHARARYRTGQALAPDVENAQAEVAVARAELEAAQREHAAQERLLRIDLDAAKLILEAAKAKYDDAQQIRARIPQARSDTELREFRFAVQQAELEVARAETRLTLHRERSQPDRPKLETPDPTTGAKDADPSALIRSRLGVTLSPLDPCAVDMEGFRGGMQIQEVVKDGPAVQAGLRVGDVLVGLQQWETTSPDNVAFVLQHPTAQNDAAGKTPLKAYVRRGNETLVVNLLLPQNDEADCVSR